MGLSVFIYFILLNGGVIFSEIYKGCVEYKRSENTAVWWDASRRLFVRAPRNGRGRPRHVKKNTKKIIVVLSALP